jgi:GalNAc-alpha-(1->4)-GalNAc-alpha-(1->3)-diNAcBac-PP-undecaprenol alpha-1,4-N-acetyl-D-galactosaminyltransferase
MKQLPDLEHMEPSNQPVKVIYIMGSGRSGSTVLDMALGSMPGIVSTGELANLYVKTDFEREYCSCGDLLASCRFWSQVLSEQRKHPDFSQDRYASLQQRYERLRSIPRLRSPWVDKDPDFQWYLRTAALIFRTARDAAGGAALVDSSKSPARALALSYSADIELIPVHLVVDPRSVVWSLQREWKADAKAGIQHPMKPVSAVAATAGWLATNWASERAKRRLPKAMFLRYEDFAAEPGATVERILSIAAVASSKEQLPAEIRPSQLHLLAGNRVRRRHQVIIRRDGAWLQGMSRARKALVRALASPLMARYGYPYSPKSGPRRIVLVIYSLGRGGAQRILTELANHWTNAGHDVVLITFAPDPPNIYFLNHNVERICLPIAGTSANALQAILRNILALRMLRNAFLRQRPEVVLSFMTRANVLTLFAARGLGLRTIISERTDPRKAAVPLIWRLLRRMSYALAESIVVQTEAARSTCASASAAWRCVVIPNPLSQTFESESESASDLRSNLGLDGAANIVIGIGHLMPHKGFDSLIRAFANCHARHPNWHLVIVGEGKEKGRLRELSIECGVAARTHLMGATQSPRRLLQQSNLFVLSSRYEGFPNSLLEAMSCGIPVVSFACPSGPEEIIQDGIDGILVKEGDVAELSKALDGMMADEVKRAALGENAQRNVQRYSPAVVLPLWDRLLGDAP